MGDDVHKAVDHREVLARGRHQEGLGTVDGRRCHCSNEASEGRCDGVDEHAFVEACHREQLTLEVIVRGELGCVDDEGALHVWDPASPQGEQAS